MNTIINLGINMFYTVTILWTLVGIMTGFCNEYLFVCAAGACIGIIITALVKD